MHFPKPNQYPLSQHMMSKHFSPTKNLKITKFCLSCSTIIQKEEKLCEIVDLRICHILHCYHLKTSLLIFVLVSYNNKQCYVFLSKQVRNGSSIKSGEIEGRS